MSAIYGTGHSIEYLEMVVAMRSLLKMNHSYKVTRVHLDDDEAYVSFKFERVKSA